MLGIIISQIITCFADDKEEGDESPRSTSNDAKEKRTSPGKSPGRAEGDSGFSEVDIKEDILPLHAQSTDPVGRVRYSRQS